MKYQRGKDFKQWDALSEKERARIFCIERYPPLPPSHAERIQVIFGIRAVEFGHELLRGIPGYSAAATTAFQNEESLFLSNYWNSTEGIQFVRQWLHERQVPYSTEIYLLYSEAVVATDWKTLIKYWDAFAWSVGVQMLALDASKSWVCEFHHEDVVTFRSYQ